MVGGFQKVAAGVWALAQLGWPPLAWPASMPSVWPGGGQISPWWWCAWVQMAWGLGCALQLAQPALWSVSRYATGMALALMLLLRVLRWRRAPSTQRWGLPASLPWWLAAAAL